MWQQRCGNKVKERKHKTSPEGPLALSGLCCRPQAAGRLLRFGCCLHLLLTVIGAACT